MIAGDTSRSLCYMRELVLHELFPNYVILIINEREDLLPGQISKESANEIIDLLELNSIQYEISSDSNINSQQVLDILSRRTEKVFIYSGFGGLILSSKILNSGKNFSMFTGDIYRIIREVQLITLVY